MYILKTHIYSTKTIITTEFDKFGDGIKAAEHIAAVLKDTMELTRHSSCISAMSHCDLYADSYNEVFICVDIKNKNNK